MKENGKKKGRAQSPRPRRQRSGEPPSGSSTSPLPPDILELLEDEEDEKTRQLDMSTPPGVDRLGPVDLSLPASSDEEDLPFFVPTPTDAGGRKTPGRGVEFPPPEKAPDRGANLSSLFDGIDLDEEVSVEMAVHELFSKDQPAPSPPLPPAPVASPSPSPSRGPDVDSSPTKAPRFARGFTQGQRPLDVNEFQTSTEPGKKKRTPELPLVASRAPAPMSMPNKVRRRRFVFTVTFRDVILLLLVVVLAAGIYTGWCLYQDYVHRQELQQLEKKQALIEQSKSKTIKKQQDKHRKTRDVP